MGLKADLEASVKKIFADTWTERKGQKVPEDTDIGLGNDAVNLTGTVLYADISDSTKLVDNHSDMFSSEIYKCFLRCAAKIIRDHGGAITAYDGDRIMAVYLGDQKNTNAAKTALQIHWAVDNIITPAQTKQYAGYPNASYRLKHTVGVDTSDMFISKSGIRGSNDLIWISRAANYAAKLTTLPDEYQTWITGDVYDKLHSSAKLDTNGKDVWERRTWTPMGGMIIYRSKATRSID